MTSSSEPMEESNLPTSLVSELQSAPIGEKTSNGVGGEARVGDGTDPLPAEEEERRDDSSSPDPAEPAARSKPILLLTNADGISSPGLISLVDALFLGGLYDIHVCAPDSDKSASGHSVTLRETLAVSSAEINGATAFQVSGTPADCVSLALSGVLFSWSRPALVISGINKGSTCGHHIFYSGAVSGPREALMCGIPSLSISLNWKKDESQESDFKDAIDVCLPLIHAAIRDIETGQFPKCCLLNIGIPTSPSTNKGFKVTKPSICRSAPTWQAVSAHRHPSGQYMSMHQSLGIQLAQLSRDASAAGTARRLNSSRKNVEVESVAAPGKTETAQAAKKYFCMEFLEKEQGDADEDVDYKALEGGYIAVTPIVLNWQFEPEIQTSAADWLASALTNQEPES